MVPWCDDSTRLLPVKFVAAAEYRKKILVRLFGRGMHGVYLLFDRLESGLDFHIHINSNTAFLSKWYAAGMTESGMPEVRNPGRIERLARAQWEGAKEWVAKLTAAAIISGTIALPPAMMANKAFRGFVNFNAEDNEAVRERLRKLQAAKEKRGIKRDFGSIMERVRHFFDRLYSEFDGDIIEWVKNSEPVLATKVDYIRLLELIDFASFWGVLVAAFAVALYPVYRTVDGYVQKMRGRLDRQRIQLLEARDTRNTARIQELETGNMALEARIKVLESRRGELQSLHALVTVLTNRDKYLAPLTPNELEKLKAAVVRGLEIFQELAQDKELVNELTPQDIAQIREALLGAKKVIDSLPTNVLSEATKPSGEQNPSGGHRSL